MFYRFYLFNIYTTREFQETVSQFYVYVYISNIRYFHVLLQIVDIKQYRELQLVHKHNIRDDIQPAIEKVILNREERNKHLAGAE